MAVTLDTARNFLVENILHAGTTQFSDTKKDYAIYTAGARFLRETDAETATSNVSVASGTDTLDITSTVTDFIRDQFIYAQINGSIVDVVPYHSIARRAEGGATGRPTQIGWLDDTEARLWPNPDAAYTMRLTYRKPMTSWTFGTSSPGSVTLGLPEEWLWDIVAMGAKFYLLSGAPGFPEAAEAGARFDQLIERARSHFSRTRPGVRDRTTHPAMGAGQ